MKKDIAIFGEATLQLDPPNKQTKNAIDNQVARLQERLKSLGVDIKRTQAHEAVAAVYGFSDWNRFQSQLDRTQTANIKPSQTPLQSSKKTPSEHQMLLLRPGEGKSLALLFSLVDGFQKNDGIRLIIDCCDDGSAYQRFPEAIKERVIHIPFSYDEKGHVKTIKYSLDDSLDGMNAIYISLGCMGFEHARSIAFCHAIEHIFSEWPKSILDQIKVLFVDDAGRLDDKVADIFDVALQRFHLNGTQIIMCSMQLFSGVSVHHRFGHPFLRKFKLITSKFFHEQTLASKNGDFRSYVTIQDRVSSAVDGSELQITLSNLSSLSGGFAQPNVTCDISKMALLASMLVKNGFKEGQSVFLIGHIPGIVSLLLSLSNWNESNPNWLLFLKKFLEDYSHKIQYDISKFKPSLLNLEMHAAAMDSTYFTNKEEFEDFKDPILRNLGTLAYIFD